MIDAYIIVIPGRVSAVERITGHVVIDRQHPAIRVTASQPTVA